MSEIFDKRFVYFMWDDELKGKTCFVADNIDLLVFAVNNDGEQGVKTNALICSERKSKPFIDSVREKCYPFAYYDPNYEVKKAFNEGKKVQIMLASGIDWRDVECEDAFEQFIKEGRKFRIKPKEENWIVYLARKSLLGKNCYLTACKEDAWETAQEAFAAKTKLFIGSKSEALEWYKPKRKFAEVIKAWEDGKTIQIKNGRNNWFNIKEPDWGVNDEYRVKPECPCEDGMDSKACAGCKHSEDGKPRINKNYAEGACKDCLERKRYRPYESSAEMIADYIDRFKVNCPSYCEPLIWVRLKVDKRERLIVAYGTNFVEIGNKAKAVTLQKLFDDYEFLDGSPCGKEC